MSSSSSRRKPESSNKKFSKSSQHLFSKYFFSQKKDSEINEEQKKQISEVPVNSVGKRPLEETEIGKSNKKRKTLQNAAYPKEKLKLPSLKQVEDVTKKRRLAFSFNPSSIKISDKPSSVIPSERHEDFVKKLEKVEKSKALQEKENSVEDDYSDGTNDVNVKKGTKKLTPMNQQYVDLKKQHPDVLLLIEMGYKYQMFGSDAQTVSKELHTFIKPGKLTIDPNDPNDAKYDTYAYTTFLSTALDKNVSKLVKLGYKVGIVEQMETSALKAQGSNKSAPFQRKLTRLYTKGTYIYNQTMESFQGKGLNSNRETVYSDGYLIAICENKTFTDQFHIGFLAIQLSTGEVIIDQFQDTVMHTELETRLLHLSPLEILLVGKVNSNITKLIDQLTNSNTLNLEPRIAKVDQVDESDVSMDLHNFYKNLLSEPSNEEFQKKTYQYLDYVDQLPNLVKICLVAVINYLKEFELETVFKHNQTFIPFSSKSHMNLNGNTIVSLELFQNLFDHTSHGSLFSILDFTRTPFGQRLLKKWITKPLVDKNLIEERISVTQELAHNFTESMSFLLNSMSKLPDLEKGLASIYYKRIKPRQLYYFLSNIKGICNIINNAPAETFQFTTKPLKNIVDCIKMAFDPCNKYLDELNTDQVSEFDSDITCVFKNQLEKYDEISDFMIRITLTQEDIENLCFTTKSEHGFKTLSYVTINKSPYYFNVSTSETGKVPTDWIKYSQTKTYGRYRSPDLEKKIRDLLFLQDSLKECCQKAYKSFLQEISDNHFETFKQTIQSLATLDCFLSLTAVSAQSGYVKPQFVDAPCIKFEQGRHPVVERFKNSGGDTEKCENNDNNTNGAFRYVPNDTKMETDDNRVVILTGPNMGGKSSYARQVGLICIMAQIGSFVPCKSACLGIIDGIYTRMGAQDNFMRGESTFQVELKECRDILVSATDRSLVILDEIGRGTGTMDGVSIAYAVLKSMIEDVKSFTLFITHYQNLTKVAAESTNNSLGKKMICNYHMGFKEHDLMEDNDTDKSNMGFQKTRIEFLYTLEPGIAHRSYGLYVAQLANLSPEIIQRAYEISKHLETVINKRKLDKWTKIMCQFLLDYEKSNEKEKKEEFSIMEKNQLKYLFNSLEN